MALEERTRPYEFLARWGEDGTLAGAHVQNITEVVKDGVVLAATVGDAMSVAVAGGAGFPLKDVLSGVQADALAAAEKANKEAQAARERASTAAQAQADAEVERDNAKGQVLQLQQQLAELAAQAREKELAAGKRFKGLEDAHNALLARIAPESAPA